MIPNANLSAPALRLNGVKNQRTVSIATEARQQGNKQGNREDNKGIVITVMRFRKDKIPKSCQEKIIILMTKREKRENKSRHNRLYIT